MLTASAESAENRFDFYLQINYVPISSFTPQKIQNALTLSRGEISYVVFQQLWQELQCFHKIPCQWCVVAITCPNVL